MSTKILGRKGSQPGVNSILRSNTKKESASAEVICLINSKDLKLVFSIFPHGPNENLMWKNFLQKGKNAS
jgi:hypothetical protein